ncbi:MAG: hypothetical protein EHM58_15185 [Ignavibacteriae bacterium]|nr:MAG: hypothetical protein EHM58_15185 [Ignavibacteriota bacterium]
MKNTSASYPFDNFPLYRNIFTFILIFLSLVSFQIFSQNSVDFDSVKTGKTYKFIMFDETEYIGKVLSVNSARIRIVSDKIIYNLSPDDIFSITKDNTPTVYSIFMNIRGGAVVLGESKYSYSNREKIFGGYNIGIDNVIPIDEKKGIRFDLLYCHIFRPENNAPGNYYQNYYDDVQMYSFSGNFVLGSFRSDNKFYYYANAGAGIHITSQGATTNTHYDVQNNLITEITEHDPNIGFFMSFGVLGGIKLTKKLGAFINFQANFYGQYHEIIIIGRESNFPFSAGVSYFF